MARLISFFSLCSLWLCCDAYKILVVFPFHSKSHNILGTGVVKHLLEAGHQVTYITPFPTTNLTTNLQLVDVSKSIKNPPQDILNLQMLMEKKVDLGNDDLVHQFTLNMMVQIMQDQNLRDFLGDPKQQFDAVIVEWMFSEIWSGFSAVFDCPLIWFFPFEDPAVVLRLIDEYPNPAYTPSLKLSRDTTYTFQQRVISLWTHAMSSYKKNFKFLEDDSRTYNRYFTSFVSKRGRRLPLYEDIIMNASLALVNAHISFGLSLKRPFSYVNIGGYHIDSDVKPLPQDLKKIMDDATHGVIYFSMGSNLQSKQLPEQLKKDLLLMFAQFKQTVLWKFEEALPDLPKNVHILKWAPQPSILSHPNCVLFITHGGLLSTTETVHFGVPAIGIPVFGDQFQNVDAAAIKGYVKRVDLSYSLASDLGTAIKEVLNDPKYMAKAKELSQIYHDRPISPGAELVHWVEHVVRTRGAPHLRSPALHVPWYQKIYLDLFCLILNIIFITIAVVKYVIRFMKQVPKKKKEN